jgi:hypothetical protein
MGRAGQINIISDQFSRLTSCRRQDLIEAETQPALLGALLNKSAPGKQAGLSFIQETSNNIHTILKTMGCPDDIG